MYVQVVGIDFCGRFIDAAMKIQGGKVLQCGSQQVAKLPSQTDPSRIQFKQVYYKHQPEIQAFMYSRMYVYYVMYIIHILKQEALRFCKCIQHENVLCMYL